ncbi:hypothetical protein [Streptomyces sp. NPDC059092]|uniref:hypothetical protein n=1 Tax=Streptomyces sp. NPDC059092 TaxID=3346725 RepID=UPI0036B386E8
MTKPIADTHNDGEAVGRSACAWPTTAEDATAPGGRLLRQGVEYHSALISLMFRAPDRASLVSRARSTGTPAVSRRPPRVQPEFIK